MSDPDKTQSPPTPPTDLTPEKGKGKKTATKITVKGPEAGRWRAGRKFGAEPLDIQLDELNDDELAALKGDPALMCVIS